MNKKILGKQPIIEFISTVPGLADIEEARPKPAKAFIPDWWKNIPKSEDGELIKTVKNCPAFPDFFGQGYIIPMWADTTIICDKEAGVYKAISGRDNKTFTWSIHMDQQFINYVTPNMQGSDANFVFKANSPWEIVTKPGYSVYQLPLFYHFNNDFSVMPGVIDTDIYHQVNQTVLYHGDGKEIFIKRGQPFAQYIPFKREKSTFDVRDANEKDTRRFNAQDAFFNGKFVGNGGYRSLQRMRKDGV